MHSINVRLSPGGCDKHSLDFKANTRTWLTQRLRLGSVQGRGSVDK